MVDSFYITNSSPNDGNGSVSSGHIKSVDGTKIFFSRRGSGTPLVILNNFFMTAEHWEPYTRKLSKYYEVINYDLRHQGNSDRVEGDIDVKDHLSDLRALIDQLELGRVSFLNSLIRVLERDFCWMGRVVDGWTGILVVRRMGAQHKVLPEP